MKRNLRKIVCQSVLAVGVAAGLMASASAQHGNIQSVTFYTVKPDRVGDFEAEIKELNALDVKAGSTRYASVWVSLTGPREFVRASYYNKWAELDAGDDPKLKDVAADAARITTRILACTDSWRRIIVEVQPDLSVESNDMPKMIRVLTTDVRPEKYREYLALVKSDILPAAQKGSLKMYEFSETRYGAPNTQVTSIVAMDNWGELDGGQVGVQKGLGKEGYENLLLKVRPLILQSVVNEYRFLPDLSFLPPSTAK